MNRPGQPPQRPPNLGPGAGMNAPYRPYPGAYAMPPRNPLQQGYPGMQTNHRTAGNMVLPSPNYMPPRSQASFPFAGSIGQHQAAQPQHQPPLQQHQQPQPQPQLSSTSSLPPHLSQNTTSNLPSALSVPAAEVGLDPNDFPALGSAATGTSHVNPTTSSPATTLASTYASQAGTVSQAGSTGQSGSGGNANGSQASRDFTADDFPALGGQSQSAQATTSNQDTSHPPGLNGFSQNEHHTLQHRQNILSSLSGSLQSQSQAQPNQSTTTQQQQPGVLNLGTQRNVHPGFGTDPDKRNLALKSNQSNNASWNAPATNMPATQLNNFPSNLPNGLSSHTHQQQNHLPSQHLNAPPGVSAPTPFHQQQQQPQHSTNHQSIGAQPPFNSNTQIAPDTTQLGSQPQSQAHGAIPQTPAQQVLMSPADRWGLLGLLAMIKSADRDQNLLSIGTDLGTMGLDMQTAGNLSSSFITPWADSSAAHTVEPDFHLPTCYNVHPPPPGPTKVAAFSEETLFFMFYAHPRDGLQEVAAQELFNRNWRYHKELRLWLTKETGTRPSKQVESGEQGMYTFWDPDSWEKSRKEFTVLYADLEEKPNPAFVGPTLQQAPQNAALQQQHLQNQTPTSGMPTSQGPRAFQGVGIAAAAGL